MPKLKKNNLPSQFLYVTCPYRLGLCRQLFLKLKKVLKRVPKHKVVLCNSADFSLTTVANSFTTSADYFLSCQRLFSNVSL